MKWYMEPGSHVQIWNPFIHYYGVGSLSAVLAILYLLTKMETSPNSRKVLIIGVRKMANRGKVYSAWCGVSLQQLLLRAGASGGS